jgi:hypothetical protein
MLRRPPAPNGSEPLHAPFAPFAWRLWERSPRPWSDKALYVDYALPVIFLFREYRGHPVQHLYLLITFMGVIATTEAVSTTLRERLATTQRAKFWWDMISVGVYLIAFYLFFEYVMPPA